MKMIDSTGSNQFQQCPQHQKAERPLSSQIDHAGVRDAAVVRKSLWIQAKVKFPQRWGKRNNGQSCSHRNHPGR